VRLPGSGAPASSLRIGRTAPEFALRNQHGQTVSLFEHRGHRAVVVMFYPYAFSRICTSELAEVRDILLDLPDATVLAVSCDPMFALRAFAEAEQLSFDLLSDFWPHGEVTRRYGVFDEERGCPLRGTFVVDRQGVLRWKLVNDVPVARDVVATRQALEALIT
jgi:peroxiredoxin